MEQDSFVGFLKRVRAGDQQAAADLVRLYEPEIRREVRLRLRDTRLRRDFDSVDICQSVLASFFVRAALGQYELDDPHQLVKLLVTMTRNKLIGKVRKQRTQIRDHRRLASEGHDRLKAVAAGPTPSELVMGSELLEEFRKRMSPQEWQLAERRSQGLQWAQIAAELGGTPDGLRKQLARAVDRIARELGLDEVSHE
jgi:RNA polymerase sigma-70 factor (ECF subfamily)